MSHDGLYWVRIKQTKDVIASLSKKDERRKKLGSIYLAQTAF